MIDLGCLLCCCSGLALFTTLVKDTSMVTGDSEEPNIFYVDYDHSIYIPPRSISRGLVSHSVTDV